MVSKGGRGRRIQCGWALEARVGVGSTDGWVQAASAPDSVLIEYYKVTQKRLFLITLVY